MKQAESGLESLFNRAVEVRETSIVDSAIRQRIADAAQELDRTGVMQAHLGIAHEAIAKLLTLIYKTDGSGHHANVDWPTGRITIAKPWGNDGWRQWQMRKWEAICLRRLLLSRQGQKRRWPTMFHYDSGSWYINNEAYSDLQKALQWLQNDGPKLAEWRSIVTDFRDAESERVRKRRGV